MAKTELTLQIEDLLYTYNPDSTGGCTINKFRPRHIGYEVPVSTGTISDGLVDCVRIDEILVRGRSSRGCTIGRNPSWYKKNHPDVLNYVHCSKGITNIDDFPEFCEDDSCMTSCLLRDYDNEICVTCYEIKVTKEDFHSNHGHNFVGNANYYVMPNDLYKQVKDEISEDIGVIVYRNTDKFVGLRRVKECVYKDIDYDSQRWMILNVLKKQLNHRSYNQINDIVVSLLTRIDRKCSTCDHLEECSSEDNRRRDACTHHTGHPYHGSLWECMAKELRSCGFVINNGATSHEQQEAMLFE